MACIAVIAPPLAGHLEPLQALAAALDARGHRTVFVGVIDAGERICCPASFEPVGAATHPPGALAVMTARMGALSVGVRGVLALRPVLRDLAGLTAMLCDEAPAVLRRLGADLVVADQTEAAGGLVARHLGLPYVSVACALPINEEVSVPPPFTGWGYDPLPAGCRRNRGGYRVSRLLSGTLNRVILERAQRWELGSLRSLTDCLSPIAQISQMVGALDFPREHLPQTFKYVGPLRVTDAGAAEVLPSDRPIALATLGTLQGGRKNLFAAIAEACRRAGVRCVIAHGGRLSADAVAGLPGDPIVRGWVNQRAVLRQATVAVTHGGLNTVLDALAAGVPLVVVPLAFEQAAIGARVAYHRVGRVVPWRTGFSAMTEALEEALLAIAADPGYAENAAAMARDIAGSGGAHQAADIVEAALTPRWATRCEADR